MAIKFYGGHQLNSKAKVYGTRQDFEVIEVDENGDAITEASAYFLTRSNTGMPRTLYLRSTDDLDATPTTLVNTASGFGTNNDMAVHPSGQYIAVADIYEGGDGVVFVYDTQDLSAPLATLSPDGGEATYNQNYQFGRSMAMSDTKLFVGNDAQGVPVYCYDLSDLSAAPSKIPTPTTYHNGDFKFSSDMAANSTHLFIGHSQCRNPLTSNDNQTEAGAVHVYDVTTLQYQTTVYGFNPEYGDYFGSEVKATDTHLAVGAYGDDEANGIQNQNGAVYVFDATDLSATPTKVMPQTSGHSDEFARFISLSDTHLAVSEYQDSTHNNNSGALHIYDLTDLSNPMINYGSLYSEYYGLRPLLFNDGSNRICFYRSFANLGQPAKYFVYNIDDLDTPLWESETEQPYAYLPPYTPVTPASQVSLHLNGTDSGIVDSSSNSHAVTISGDTAVVSGSPHDSTTSMSFDGSGDMVSTTVAGGLGAVEFTVEFWMYRESDAGYMFNNRTGGGNSDGIDIKSDLEITTANNRFFNGTSLENNRWYHVALTRDSSYLTKLFIDGVNVGSATVSNAFTGSSVYVGGSPHGNVGYFNGKIADFRIIQGTALYTADFTVPTSALTGSAGSQVAFAKLSTTDVKSSYPPVITNDGLTVSASTSVDQWTHGRATMSFTSGKYYWEATPNGNGMIGLELDTADGDRATFNDGQHVLAARDGKIWKDEIQVVSGQSDWTDGDVVGIAVDGDTGLVQFYVNGVETMSHNTGWGSDKVKLPAYGVYKYSSHDWSWTFNFGEGGFAYSAPEGYQALSGTETITPSLLISGNGGVSDESSSSHTLTLNGDVTTALGSPYTSGNVIAFDGNGDFAHISNADFSYGTGDFTIEAWINSDDVTASGPRNIFTQRSQGGPVLRLWNSKLHYMRGAGQNALYSAENLLTAGQWHHVALVRSSGVVSIYLDGTSVASQAETYDFSSLTEVYVGSYGSQYEFFDGEIADFRITKAAVYTENFSVPTAALGDYPPPPLRYYKTLATQYVPPPPPPDAQHIVVSDFRYNNNTGRVSIYDANNLSASPTILEESGSGQFGKTSSYGATLFVGSAFEATQTGALYIYDDIADTSSYSTKLTAYDGVSGDWFGQSSSANGTYLAVSAHYASTNGAVYVFDMNDYSAQPTKIVAPSSSSNYARFGDKVKMNQTHLFVSMPGYNSEGAVFAYDLSDLSASPVVFNSQEGEAGAQFGTGIDVTDTHLLITCSDDDTAGNNAGAGFVYDLSDMSAAPTKLTPADLGANDNAGYTSAAISDTHVAFGGLYHDPSGVVNAGAVWVYDVTNLSAAPTKVTAATPTSQAYFGQSVTIGGTSMLVGENGTWSAYVFDLTDLSAAPTTLSSGLTSGGFGEGPNDIVVY